MPLQVRADTNFVELLDANPWLKTTKLVVKPDMLFGKRGKHDLVGLNLDFAGVEAFIKARMGKVVDMDGCVGAISTFVVEPFVPHKQEYYLCIQVCLKDPDSRLPCNYSSDLPPYPAVCLLSARGNGRAGTVDTHHFSQTPCKKCCMTIVLMWSSLQIAPVWCSRTVWAMTSASARLAEWISRRIGTR